MSRLVATVATVPLIAIAVGCGGGSSEGDPASAGEPPAKSGGSLLPTNASLTKAKYLAHVNELCRRKWYFVHNAVRQTRVLKTRRPPKLTPREGYIRAVRLSYFVSLNFLIFDWVRRLGAPPGERQALEPMLDSMQEAIERGSRNGSFTDVAGVKALFADYNRRARRYGLDRCLVAGAHLPYPET